MIIPPRTRPGLKRAFSLIELLVVMTIIGILIGIIIPVGHQVQKQMRRTAASKDCTELRTAISNYYTEYKKYPPIRNSEQEIATDGSGLISTLIADDSSDAERYNPRGILFFSGKASKHPDTPGLSTQGNPRFNDPWSVPGDPHPYYVIYDLNYDNKVEAPRAKGGGTQELFAPVAVWSYGPDGEPGGDDNITSY